MSHKLKLIQFFFILGLMVLNSSEAFSFQMMNQISAESGVIYGKLKNGFTYYIKPAQGGTSKVDMRLIVKVGSQHENPDQYQFVHLLEHIAANEGREKYSELLLKVGISFMNTSAWVWNDHTIYSMTLPGGEEEARGIGLPFFKHKLELKIHQESIDKERRTILNEFNGGLKNKDFILTNLERELTLLGESNYPNDFVSYLYQIKPDSLIKFYKKWYQPDLMALVIVGDITDIEQMEKEIEKVFFKNLPSYAPQIRRNTSFNYLKRKPTYLKAGYDSDITEEGRIKNNLIRLYMRQKDKEDKNYTQILEDELVRNLLVSMLTRRYNEKLESNNSTYKIFSNFLDPPFAFKINISSNGNPDKEIVKKAFQAIKEVEYFGFSAQEFTQGKQDLLKQIKNIDTTTTSYWVNKIIDHYVRKQPIVHNQKEIMKTLLTTLPLHKFNLLVKSYLEGEPEDIVLVGDSGDPILSLSENIIRGWFSEVDSMSIKSYSNPEIPKFLLNPFTLSNLKEGNYKIEKPTIPGAKEYILENGLKIIIKPYAKVANLTPENNPVYFQGIVKTGISCFARKDYFSALHIPDIVLHSGVGGFNKFDLVRYLKSQEFEGRVYPYIEKNDSGIKGRVKLKELETALQLVYLYMTLPNSNKFAFEDWKQQKLSNSQYRDINREDFISSIRESFSSIDHLSTGTKEIDGIEEIDFKRAIEIYQDLFRNPKDLTFMFTGDFPEGEILNLCRKYLGNLPNIKKNSIECNADLDSRHIPTKPFFKSINPTQPTKLALIRISFLTPLKGYGLNWKEQLKTEILRRVLSSLVMERLRFKTGFIYQSVGGLSYERPSPFLEFFIEYECLPENMEESIMESKKMIDFLINERISEPLFREVINSAMSSIGEVDSYRLSLKKMYDKCMYDEPWVENSEKRKYIGLLTRQDLLETAQKYLKVEPHEFTMVPN